MAAVKSPKGPPCYAKGPVVLAQPVLVVLQPQHARAEQQLEERQHRQRVLTDAASDAPGRLEWVERGGAEPVRARCCRCRANVQRM